MVFTASNLRESFDGELCDRERVFPPFLEFFLSIWSALSSSLSCCSRLFLMYSCNRKELISKSIQSRWLVILRKWPLSSWNQTHILFEFDWNEKSFLTVRQYRCWLLKYLKYFLLSSILQIMFFDQFIQDGLNRCERLSAKRLQRTWTIPEN